LDWNVASLISISPPAVLHETGPQVTTDERVIIKRRLAIDGGVLFGTKHLEFNNKSRRCTFSTPPPEPYAPQSTSRCARTENF